jgi:hypothetical protein
MMPEKTYKRPSIPKVKESAGAFTCPLVVFCAGALLTDTFRLFCVTSQRRRQASHAAQSRPSGVCPCEGIENNWPLTGEPTLHTTFRYRMLSANDSQIQPSDIFIIITSVLSLRQSGRSMNLHLRTPVRLHYAVVREIFTED